MGEKGQGLKGLMGAVGTSGAGYVNQICIVWGDAPCKRMTINGQFYVPKITPMKVVGRR